MKSALLVGCLPIILLANNSDKIKKATLEIDISELPSGYTVKYEVQGEIVSLINDKKNRNQNELNKNIQSKKYAGILSHNNKSSLHDLEFKIDEETLNGIMRLKLPFAFRVYDEAGNLVYTSVNTFNSNNKHTVLTLRSNGLTSDGKPNILIHLGKKEEFDSVSKKTIKKPSPLI
jgi:hypothetical protein